jgi:hypothetical protein
MNQYAAIAVTSSTPSNPMMILSLEGKVKFPLRQK